MRLPGLTAVHHTPRFPQKSGLYFRGPPVRVPQPAPGHQARFCPHSPGENTDQTAACLAAKEATLTVRVTNRLCQTALPAVNPVMEGGIHSGEPKPLLVMK